MVYGVKEGLAPDRPLNSRDEPFQLTVVLPLVALRALLLLDFLMHTPNFAVKSPNVKSLRRLLSFSSVNEIVEAGVLPYFISVSVEKVSTKCTPFSTEISSLVNHAVPLLNPLPLPNRRRMR